MRRLIEPSHMDLCCLQKPIIMACGSERVKLGLLISLGYQGLLYPLEYQQALNDYMQFENAQIKLRRYMYLQ